jgi:hypothetical protein
MDRDIVTEKGSSGGDRVSFSIDLSPGEVRQKSNGLSGSTFYLKTTSFCQDRLGTNIELNKRDRCFAGACAYDRPGIKP